MKILIIGSYGFIGSYVASELNTKYEIFGCDIIPSTDRLYYQVDRDSPTYAFAFKENQFDVCINCAGSANVQESIINPLNDFNSNLANLCNLLEVIIKYNPECKLINISSAAVYGNALSLPISVSSPLNPLSPYGVHKMLADNLVTKYAELFNISVCSVRIFSAYGNGQKKLFLWDCFQKISNTPKGGIVNFYGTGHESRDYIHISDIVQQIELVIDNAPFKGEVYNVANGEEVLIKDIIQLMQQALNKELRAKFSGTTRPGDPVNWRADISPMIEWGYKKSVPIQTGVKDYIQWAQENA